MIEQLELFKLGGKVENRIVKDFTLESLIKGLDTNELTVNTNNILSELLSEEYTANLTLKDDRVLKLYFNLLMKYPNIKGSADIIDMIAVKRYYERFGGENSKLVINVLDRYFDKIDTKDAEDFEEIAKIENESKVINSIKDIPPILLKIIPQSQAQALVGNTEIYSTLIRLAEEVMETPALYSQDGLGNDAIVHIHYFSGGSDWFITEMNLDEALFFGYVVLNGDLVNSEFGYTSIDEITSTDIELDFHFTKMTVKEAITKYHGE